MYDAISSDYDRFVNWPARLAGEMPFIEQQLQKAVGLGCRVLDAACGTGMHALTLAQHGYRISGADLSRGMIARARANAATAGVSVRFEAASFGGLAKVFGQSTFDALLCLGNSLPHILEPASLAASLADFATCLQPGGLILLQNRNFDAVLARRERWMEPQAYRKDEAEWLFLRFYDFDPDELLSFHMITLHRRGTGVWTQQVTTTRLYPLRQNELVAALSTAGFTNITCYGSMTGTPFDLAASSNLVISANLQ
jgi:glycine/sarcosine N-methyltransferase/sarcosine/dimethylglycine N-methyltransferase